MKTCQLAVITGLVLSACVTAEQPDHVPVVDAHEHPLETLPPPQAECDARWLPSPCTEAVAAPQWVNYQSAAACTGGPSAGALELAEFLAATFPGHGGYGIYDCRPIQGGTALSLHGEGRAIDFMIPMDPSQPFGANNAIGDPVAAWLMEHAEDVGIQSFSWDRTIYYGNEAVPKHHCLSVANGHWDHLHIELTWDAANRLTPWFNPPTEPGSAAADPGHVWPALQPLGEPSGVTFPTTARRQFDTRSAASSLLRGDGTRTGRASGTNHITSWTGLAAGASSVWLNTTVIPQTIGGFLTAFPAGQSRPDTSNLNFSCQTVRANATPVPLGTGDDVSLYLTTEVDLIGDLYASFTPEGDGLIASDPLRIIDTRQSTHVTAGDSLIVDVTCPSDAADCRDEDITGVLASVTVIGRERSGFITAYPCGDPVPNVSQINVQAGEVIANTVFTRIRDGQLCIYSYEDADILVDLAGVTTPSASTRYQAIQPQRILDTRRTTDTPYSGRVAAQQVLTLPIQSLSHMPAHARTVVMQITTVDSDGSNFVTAYPCELGAPPDSSVLNTDGSGPLGTLATSRVGADGTICVQAYQRTHLLVDILGAWVEHDSDGDGAYDFEEVCIDDPAKTSPGACGCGTPDTDTDGDQTPDCIDGCIDDPLKTEPGVCGCGQADEDLNGDGLIDCPTCGDGVVEPGETCDDGNEVGGDSCSSTCAIEPLTLAAPSVLPTGVSTPLVVQHVAPGQDVVLLRGTPGGSTPVPGCPSATVPLTRVRVIRTATAASTGDATLLVSPPSTASGRSVHLVAVDRNSCRTSTAHHVTVP